MIGLQDFLKTNTEYSFVSSLIPDFMNALYNEEAFNKINKDEIRDAFRKKQIAGKAWLIENLLKTANQDSNILVIGSWLGFTSYCLYKKGFCNITEIDIDDRVSEIAKHLNRVNNKFNHITGDANDIEMSKFDIIINTSTEHILNDTWFKRIKDGSLVVLQSTDYVADDHFNTCISDTDLCNKFPMNNILYQNTLNLDQYSRFMILGVK
jgi:hypothetical protein